MLDQTGAVGMNVCFALCQSHVVVCSLCKRDGHLKKDCPEDFKKVKLDPLPPATADFLHILSQVCEQCYSEYRGS